MAFEIPFLTPLLRLKWSSHKKALKEVGISGVLSTLPIWLGGILGGMIAKAKSTQADFFGVAFDNMSEFVSQGELYMLAVATLAPIFYIGSSLEKGGAGSNQNGAGSVNKSAWPFPQSDIHRFFVALFIAVAAVVFFYMRKENLSGTGYVMTVSLFFYAISLVMIYAATAQNEERTSFQPFVDSADDEKDFRDDYASHRGAR